MKTNWSKITFEKGEQAFTLVELLVVLAIMAILLNLAVPTFTTVLAGSNLSRAGLIVGDQFGRARQEAVSMNQDVEIRFLLPTASGVGQTQGGVQLFRVSQSSAGATLKPMTKFIELPQGVEISGESTYSPLFGLVTKGSMNIPEKGDFNYYALRIHSNGRVGITTNDATRTCITLKNTNDSGTLKNYYTIQINPLTAKVTVYRP